MEETYPTKAIILDKRSFKEFDTLVTIFSFDKGRLDLVARGTKKIKSKLSGHTEPISFSDIMVIKGKAYDYVGGASVKNSFFNLKNDLDKIILVGKSINLFKKIIKGEDAHDADILFLFLLKYLELIDKEKIDLQILEILHNVFILKLLSILGYKPELDRCISCHEKIKAGQNYMDYSKGGLVCDKCHRAGITKISENCIKILRIAIKEDFKYIFKVKISKNLLSEIDKIVESYYNYYVNS